MYLGFANSHLLIEREHEPSVGFALMSWVLFIVAFIFNLKYFAFMVTSRLHYLAKNDI